MLILVTAVGTARERLIARLQSSPVLIKKWGAWILVGVGVWFIALAIWADFFASVFPV